jgi:hypothetical protein
MAFADSSLAEAVVYSPEEFEGRSLEQNAQPDLTASKVAMSDH